MKKHGKKLIALVLVMMLLISAVSVSIFSSYAAPSKNIHKVGLKNEYIEYTTTEPVEPTVEPTAISVDPDFTPDPNKVYFQVPEYWNNYKNITLFIYEHGGEEVVVWGSKKGNMTDEGNGLWSFDFNAKGYSLSDNTQYGVIFTADWEVQTCDIIFDKTCLGDIAYCPGEKVENNIVSYRKSYLVKWLNADPKSYAPPVCITSIGNVIGEAYWKDETPESLLTVFLTSEGMDGIRNAVRYNGKTLKQTAYDTGAALGLSEAEVDAIADKIGFDLDEEYDPYGPSYDPYEPSYDPYDPSYDPYDPSYDPYEPSLPGDNAYEAAQYVKDNMYDPYEVSPAKLKQKFEELDVTPEEVDEALFYSAWDYKLYKQASELVHKADSSYMDILKGDVNNDGVVDVLDATWIQKLIVEKISSFDDIK